MQYKSSTTRLPRSLLDQIDTLDDKSSGSRLSLKQTHSRNRRQQRKQGRDEKKQFRRNAHPLSTRLAEAANDSEIDLDESDDGHQRYTIAKVSHAPSTKASFPEKAQLDAQPPKPVIVEKKVQPVIRKAVADKLEEDDAEIAALEKRLKIKGGKLPKSFQEDNLDWLIDGISSEDEEQEDYKQYLAEKRGKKRKIGQVIEEQPSVKVSEVRHVTKFTQQNNDGVATVESENSPELDIGIDNEDDNGGESMDWDGFSSGPDEDDNDEASTSQNPSIEISHTDTTSEKPASTKYIPPAQRRQLSENSTDSESLRKKLQGQVNRLTESSMLQIVKAIEDFYRDYPRQMVTSTLTSLILSSISNEVNTKETFFTLYGGFVAALYRILGTDFGAYFVQNVVEDFDRCYYDVTKREDGDLGFSSSKKQANDLISVLAELYNFGVIGSTLIFDFIRILVSEVNEINAELLLKFVRSSGPQLRQDDPSSLKDIVSMLQASTSKVGAENLSTRIKFMLETLTNLKNNKARRANDSSVVASEAIVRMKKMLGTLNGRQLRASEPLRPSLQDIRDVDKKGKWWLVGASWRHNMADNDKPESGDSGTTKLDLDELDDGVTNFLQLAREQRMNTDIRRAIFVAIMSGEDYSDARERILKLRLKKAQEREIPHVLLHCCGSEAQYNPYYTLIAQQLCSQHSLRMTLQFSLWQIFRKMGEEDDMSHGDINMDEEDDEKMPLRKIVNLAKMYGYLVANGALPITILKTLQLVSLQPATKNFLEIFFISIFTEIRERFSKSASKREMKVKEVFRGTAENAILARGLDVFLKKQVAHSDIIGSKRDKEAVQECCHLAGQMLKTIILEGTRHEDIN